MEAEMPKQFPPLTETILTLGATLVMGMVDAYTFLEQGSVFVSAQTGNLVLFVVKFIEHGWSDAWVNVPVWIGYFLGCFIAQGLSEHVDEENKRLQMRNLMLIDVLVYFVLAATQGSLTTIWLIFILGIVAGYELTIFRQVGVIAINNSIMTGNTKSLATSSYQAWVDHDGTARRKQHRIAQVLATFILGCALGAVLTKLETLSVLWVASVIKLLLLAWLFTPSAMDLPKS